MEPPVIAAFLELRVPTSRVVPGPGSAPLQPPPRGSCRTSTAPSLPGSIGREFDQRRTRRARRRGSDQQPPRRGRRVLPAVRGGSPRPPSAPLVAPTCRESGSICRQPEAGCRLDTAPVERSSAGAQGGAGTAGCSSQRQAPGLTWLATSSWRALHGEGTCQVIECTRRDPGPTAAHRSGRAQARSSRSLLILLAKPARRARPSRTVRRTVPQGKLGGCDRRRAHRCVA